MNDNIGMTELDSSGRQLATGSVPRSWLGITGDWSARQSLALLRAVDAAGVAHDDLDGVRRVWEAMSSAVRALPLTETERALLLRALSSFRGDCEAGVVDDPDEKLEEDLLKLERLLSGEEVVDGPTPRVYLDLVTSVLTEQEMNELGAAPPRVILHEYGAWVHVPPVEGWEAGEDPLDPNGDEDWEDFPNLNAVLRAARELGADWVNLDADGHDVIPGLPTFVW